MNIQDNISFTTGFYVAFANIAKLLGKISIGPIVVSFPTLSKTPLCSMTSLFLNILFQTAMHSYREALLVPIFACAFSLGCYLLFHASNTHGSIYLAFTNTGTTRARAHSEVAVRIRKGSIEATLSDETTSLVGDTQDQPLPEYDSFKSIDRVSVDEESAERSVEDGHAIHRYDLTCSNLSDGVRFISIHFNNIH